MPDIFRHSLSTMLEEVKEAYQFGVKSFDLFPKVADHLKTNYGEEAYNPAGIVPRAIRMIKEKFPDVVVVTDVALDPYSSMVNYPFPFFSSYLKKPTKILLTRDMMVWY